MLRYRPQTDPTSVTSVNWCCLALTDEVRLKEKGNSLLISLALSLATLGINVEQPHRNWVYFQDKNLSGAELARAMSNLESQSWPQMVARRKARRTAFGLFDQRDLPVAPKYVEQLEAAGLKVHVTSRWLNAVSVEGDVSQIGQLACVSRIEPVRRGTRNVSDLEVPEFGLQAGVTPQGPGLDYGLATEQLNQISVPAMHQRGFTGRGVIIGILDTGFVTTHTAFHQPGHELSIVAARDFINNDGDVGIQAGDPDGQHGHGTLILGCIASYFPSSLIGGGFDAQVVLCKTEDVSQEVPVEEDNYIAGLEFAELHGADVITSSLGYIDWYTQSQLNGLTAVTSIGVNVATENGVICCTAAGNSGHDTDPLTSHMLAPADALQVFGCGAADSAGVIAGFSSDGPSADGRIKPEILARGVSTRTINPGNDTGYASASGTSLSTPLVGAAMVCAAQARPWWSVDRLRAAVFATASDFAANGVADPERVRGYGMLNINAAIDWGCAADYNWDGTADFFDYLDFVDAFSANLRSSDFNGDAIVDFFDYLDFVDVFSLGC